VAQAIFCSEIHHLGLGFDNLVSKHMGHTRGNEQDASDVIAAGAGAGGASAVALTRRVVNLTACFTGTSR
jgi:hypothetical protein